MSGLMIANGRHEPEFFCPFIVCMLCNEEDHPLWVSTISSLHRFASEKPASKIAPFVVESALNAVGWVLNDHTLQS